MCLISETRRGKSCLLPYVLQILPWHLQLWRIHWVYKQPLWDEYSIWHF